MAPKAETNFKVRVKAYLATLPHTWHVKVQQVGIRGTPDILCCIRGRFVALELKRSATAHIDPLQYHILGLISQAGGYAMVVYPENWAEVQTVLARISKLKPLGKAVP